jgi:hypothetical protein
VSSLFELLRGQAYELWRQFREDGEVARVLPMLRPIGPYAGPQPLSPLATLGVLLALAVTCGVALGAFAVLLLASLVLYLLLTEVLGLEIELRPLPF